MKKSLLILFASVLFVFNGNAQCDGGIIEISGPSTVCIGSQIIITNLLLPSNVSSNVTYQWLINGSPLYGENQAMQLVSIYGSGTSSTFQRQVTDLSNSCIAYSNQVQITYLPIAPVTVTASIFGDDTICTGSNASIITSSVSNPAGENVHYQWYINDGYNGYLVAIPGATNTSFTPTNLTTEKKYLLQYYTDAECSNAANYTDWITKTVMNCGTFSTSITGATSISPNQTVTYSVPATVGMHYVWTVTGGTITSGQGTNSITVLWDGGGSSNMRTTVADYSVSVVETDATPTSKTTSQAITMTTTGINKGFASSGISVFPNPTKNQFTIEMPTANTAVNYTVYSTTGVQMQTGSFNATASGNTISTHLPAGMYQLVLNYDGVFTSTRLAVVE